MGKGGKGHKEKVRTYEEQMRWDAAITIQQIWRQKKAFDKKAANITSIQCHQRLMLAAFLMLNMFTFVAALAGVSLVIYYRIKEDPNRKSNYIFLSVCVAVAISSFVGMLGSFKKSVGLLRCYAMSLVFVMCMETAVVGVVVDNVSVHAQEFAIEQIEEFRRDFCAFAGDSGSWADDVRRLWLAHLSAVFCCFWWVLFGPRALARSLYFAGCLHTTRLMAFRFSPLQGVVPLRRHSSAIFA
eukprot:SAG11_NODE_3472_length_2427_cov_1.326890_1_plen_241_part_00